MGKYILKRLVQIIPTFLILTLIVYMILALSPTDPVALIAGQNATVEQMEAVREELGLNDNIIVRYGKYMLNMFKGDMGKSWISGMSIYKDFMARLPNTMILSGMALALTIMVGIPLGVYSAVRQNSFGDKSILVISMLLISLPSFFIGLLAQILFCLILKWFPVQGVGSFRHYILPSIILAAARVAGQIRLTRSSMLDVIDQDYIRTANAKGASKQRIIWYHALRNGLLPVITSIGNNIGPMVAGAVTVETIFAIPGVGSMLVNAVRTSDVPGVMGPVIFISLLVCIVNLIVDLLYAVVDPRVRIQMSK